MAAKVPKFGAWENGDDLPYTVYFDNARKTKGAGPIINPNDPEMNPHLFPQTEPPNQAQAQAKAQAQAQTQARFHTRLTRDEPKVPQFGAWNSEENARKTRNGGPKITTNEPQLNRDVGAKARDPPRPTNQGRGNKEEGYHKSGSRGSTTHQSSLHQKAGKLATRGNQTPERGAVVPEWGGWIKNPGTTENYTEAFNILREEKGGRASLNKVTPSYANTPGRHPNKEKKKSCCFLCF